MSDQPPRLRRQARLMRLVNPPMRRILALPFSTPLSKRLMLLYLTGRRSGRSYRQPVSYVRDGDSLLTPGGGNWKLNLEPGRPERIRLDGRDVTARPDLIDDIDEIDDALMTMTAINSGQAWLGVVTPNDVVVVVVAVESLLSPRFLPVPGSVRLVCRAGRAGRR